MPNKSAKRERQRRSRLERKVATQAPVRTAVFTGEEDQPPMLAIFWCEACHQKTAVNTLPPAIFAKVECPMCHAGVRFRVPPTPGIVLPRRRA